MSHEEIMGNPYDMRVEFRIYSTNSLWLHLDYLRGDYHGVFERYLPLLGTLYHNYLASNISIKGRDYKEFRRVIKADPNPDTKVKVRYRAGGLKRMTQGKRMKVRVAKRAKPHEIPGVQCADFRDDGDKREMGQTTSRRRVVVVRKGMAAGVHHPE
jgi:hypothetical protein